MVLSVVMRYPDFFIAGNSKSGTTALYHFLAQHPEVCMSNPKEPNFFATDFLHEEGVGAFDRRTCEEYQQCFSEGRDDQLWVKRVPAISTRRLQQQTSMRSTLKPKSSSCFANR